MEQREPAAATAESESLPDRRASRPWALFERELSLRHFVEPGDRNIDADHGPAKYLLVWGRDPYEAERRDYQPVPSRAVKPQRQLRFVGQLNPNDAWVLVFLQTHFV